MIFVVVDTNVLFAGLTQPNSEAGQVIALWLTEHSVVTFCVCTALALEYEDLLARKLSPIRRTSVEPLFAQMINQARYVHIDYRYRPIGPDLDDNHVCECAQNAGAVLVTYNVRDFRLAQELLGLTVMTPSQFLDFLRKENLL